MKTVLVSCVLILREMFIHFMIKEKTSLSLGRLVKDKLDASMVFIYLSMSLATLEI